PMSKTMYKNTDTDEVLINHEETNDKPTKQAGEKLIPYASGYLTDNRTIYYNGSLYTYRDNCYRLEAEPEVTVLRWFQSHEIPVMPSTVKNVLALVKGYSFTDATKHAELPFFINGEHGNGNNYLPCQNGLLNLEHYC